MKKVFLIAVVLGACFLQAQTEDLIPKSNNQLKIISSIEYEKIPFKMKMFKKILPKERTSYYSRIGYREEVNIDAKFMGQEISSSNVEVTNYDRKLSWAKMIATATGEKDEVVFEEKPYSKESKSSNEIIIGEKKKEILGYHCVSFSTENDSSKTDGFLAPSIRGLGLFKNYGMPLEMTVSSKTEKMVIETKAKSILIEPLNKDLFFLTKD